MKDVWLFDILDPTQRLKTASDQRKVYAPPRMLSSLREAIFFHPTFFLPFSPTQEKENKSEAQLYFKQTTLRPHLSCADKLCILSTKCVQVCVHVLHITVS